MEKKENVVESIVVNVDNVAIDAEQYETLLGTVQALQTDVQTVNASLVHATMFLVMICVFELYGLLSRARKKGGV